MLNIKVETYKQWEIPTHLNLSALYDCPVQLLSCSVSLSCALEGDESKALQVYSVLFFISFDHWKSRWLWWHFCDTHLRAPLIEDNFYIKDLAKLLQMSDEKT